MKFIFDFDDTLFINKQFKEHLYLCLDKKGIPYTVAKKQYEELRAVDRSFSLKSFLSEILSLDNMPKISAQEAYDEIVQECPNLLNTELIEIVREMGKENCYILTSGDPEFQRDKIARTIPENLFREIIVVLGSKREVITRICDEYKNETVVFIDDKSRFFADLDMELCKNLKTVLYDEYGLENLKKLIYTDLSDRKE